MRKKLMRSLTGLTVLAAAFSLVAMGIVMVPRVDGQNAAQAGSPHKKLRDVAQERDVEITVESEAEAEYSDLGLLAQEAEAVVVGRIAKAKSDFNDSGERITTEYTIEVERVLKDVEPNAPRSEGAAAPAPLTTPLRLVRGGGVVSVRGHRAEVKVNGHDSLNPGKEYVFFLWWGPSQGAYYLAGGISGAVLVNNQNKVTPLASSSALRSRFADVDLETFIAEVVNRRQ